MKTTKPTFVLCLILLAQMAFAQQKLTFQRSTSFPCGSNVLYTGAVKNGKANGYGKAYVSYDKITDTLSPHIWIYEGYWKDNDFNGKGNLYKNYSGGDWYKGNFSNGQLHGQGETYSYYGGGIKKGIFVQGEYKGNPVGQKTLDSLLLIYKPLLKTTTSAESAVRKFVEEIKKLPEDIVKKPYLDLVAELANNNIQSTFYLVLEAPYYFKNEELLAQLNPTQKAEIRKIAQKITDDYNKKSQPASVAAQQKETPKETPPTDPCQREIWELKIKPGSYVKMPKGVAKVESYSCKTGKYSILWADGKQKLQREYTTVETMNTYEKISYIPFTTCGRCNGFGYTIEHETREFGGYLFKSDKTKQVFCTTCSGKGYKRGQ